MQIPPIIHPCRVLCLLVALGPGASALAESDEPSSATSALSVSSELFTRLEVRENYDELGLGSGRLGEGDLVVYRARFGMALEPVAVGRGIEVSAFFQPQMSGFWGESSGALADPSASLHQAKTRLSLGSSWLDVGRFEMTYGEHLVIGNVGWHEVGRAFDGLRAHGAIGTRGAFVDAFATATREGRGLDATNPSFAGDAYFVGIYAGLGPLLAEGLAVDAYSLFNIVAKSSDGVEPQGYTATEVTLGGRVKQDFGVVEVRAEGGIQIGERPGGRNDVLAYHVDGSALLRPSSTLQVGVGGLYASGDDPNTDDIESWNQLYPTAHKFLGLMDIMGARSNAGAISGLVRVSAVADLSVGLDSHLFFRPETPTGVERYTGVENDLWAAWTVGTGLSLRCMYSFFVANESGPLPDGSVAHYAEMQLRYAR